MLIHRQNLVLLFFILPFSLSSQKYIKDSLILNIERNETLNNKTFQIYNIKDKRKQSPHVFHISEKNKYGVIPVDFLYCFKDSLTSVMEDILKHDSLFQNKQGYNITFEYFEPSVRKGLFLSQYNLNSCIQIAKDTQNLGSLVYETLIPVKNYKKNEKEAYEKLIYNWQREFMSDMNTVNVASQSMYNILIPNFKPKGYYYKKNLFVITSFLAGIDWYGVEGEAFFSAPETGKPFIRNTGTIRYINGLNYESILFGKNNENYFIRINNKSVFEFQSKIFLGINKWKDIEVADHGLEEIFQVNFSVSELFQYNKLDKNGLIVSFGLLQDLYYIYNKLDYRLGLKAQIGLKL